MGIDGLRKRAHTGDMAAATNTTQTERATRPGKEGHMAFTTVPAHKVGQKLTVDLSTTVGQESAIEANGGPIFQIEVTYSAELLPPTLAGEHQEINGFGRVVSGGPVNGYEVLYKLDSVV